MFIQAGHVPPVVHASTRNIKPESGDSVTVIDRCRRRRFSGRLKRDAYGECRSLTVTHGEIVGAYRIGCFADGKRYVFRFGRPLIGGYERALRERRHARRFHTPFNN